MGGGADVESLAMKTWRAGDGDGEESKCRGAGEPTGALTRLCVRSYDAR